MLQIDRRMKYLFVKRVLDCSLAVIMSVLLSPLLLIVFLVVKLDSKGPGIFRQIRTGRGQKNFTMLKFRTMRTDAPMETPTHLLDDPDTFFTNTGKLLRSYSLDELPQLINILRGDMSFVGPRPALWNQSDLISAREEFGINDLRPGLTGWAQIHGRDVLSIEEKVEFDKFYSDHFGPMIDIRSILGTFSKVLKKNGVSEGARH